MVGFGFPLQITARVTNGDDSHVLAIISAQLRAKLGIARGCVEAPDGQTHEGAIDAVVHALSVDILEHLHAQVSRTSAT